MLIQSLSDYGNRSHYAAEIARTSVLLTDVLESMHDKEAVETGEGASYELMELSLKTGRRLKEEDLGDLVAYWVILIVPYSAIHVTCIDHSVNPTITPAPTERGCIGRNANTYFCDPGGLRMPQ